MLKKLPDKHSSVSGADEMEILYKFEINLGFIKPFNPGLNHRHEVQLLLLAFFTQMLIQA